MRVEPTEPVPKSFSPRALTELFLFLERANYLIFYDAWHHVIHHLLGRSHALGEGRVARFMREAWRFYEARAHAVSPDVERRLVLDLVTNEQNFIERRVVHAPRFETPRAIIAFIESVGREAPLVLPLTGVRIAVGGFAALSRRIETGRRIFDEVLADPTRRSEISAWALEHPHTGARSVYGGPDGPSLRDVWSVASVRALWDGIHAPAEPDAEWP